MENKIIDYMEIYRGGESGCKPMVKVTYMSNGIKQNPIDLPWDEPKIREEKILPYLNGYTLINDTRITR
jgi:hypothetical protein